MGIPRIIPILLIKKNGVVKGKNFKNHRYVGDPINIIEIFNKKNCDEIIVLDIEAREDKRIIENELLKKISKYSTMPFSIGGGIRNLSDAENILKNGAEKICICSDVIDNSNEINDYSRYWTKSLR